MSDETIDVDGDEVRLALFVADNAQRLKKICDLKEWRSLSLHFEQIVAEARQLAMDGPDRRESKAN